ncbi:exoglucanase 3 precursor [Dendryphion nanum]|uniref:Glucanase n=1 Tax=Dendryphion nanum TaxID=256645 RepID=A0A9P9E8H7_9PLEO|nr:exoglucanase 3 precursor [Dendryphion nanum]
MKFTTLLPSLLSTIPSSIAFLNVPTARQTQSGCNTPASLNASTNIWKTHKLHTNALYRSLVQTAISKLPKDKDALYKAEFVRDKAGTFVTIDGPSQIPKIEKTAQDVPCDKVLGLIISGLPWKSCPSVGVPEAKEPYDYAGEYIDPIVQSIKSHPNTAFALIIEPGVLGTVVLNKDLASCKHVRDSYRKNVPYALKALNLPNVVLYLDAEHGGVLGWKEIFASKVGTNELINAWTNAEKPKQFRGVAVNIKGYNSWDMQPGESFHNENPTCADLTNRARNEKQYLTLLDRDLSKAGMPSFGIVDTSRNGNIGIRKYWSDWCNVEHVKPGITPNTPSNHALLDAWVWAKGVGESDGTTDVNSYSYRSECGLENSFKPMPERGEWSQEYFESLRPIQFEVLNILHLLYYLT